MAKFNASKFNIGYGEDSSSDAAVEKIKEIRAIDAKDKAARKIYEARTLDIPYEDIIPNPKNRKADKNIEELAESILTFGLIHYPRVKDNGNGKYVLTSGERRWRAIGLIRKTHPELFRTVPCTFGDAAADELDEEARLIIANRDTVDPTPEEDRMNIQRLAEIYEAKKARGDEMPAGLVTTIANELQMTPRQIQKFVAINQKLIPELQDVFDEQGININDASKIAQLDEIYQKDILELFQQKKSISSGDIAYYKEEDRKLREENSEQKSELDRLRSELAILKSGNDPSNKPTFESESEPETEAKVQDTSTEEKIAAYETTIDELTKALKKTARKTTDKGDSGKHMLLQDTIARLERAQNNMRRQLKDVELDDMERQRIVEVVKKLNELLNK